MSQETTQQQRSPEDIAKNVQGAIHERQKMINIRKHDLRRAYQLVEERKCALDEAQVALEKAVSEYPGTRVIREMGAILDALQVEALMAFDPDGPRTFKDDSGAGLQYRVVVKPSITIRLAETDLWKASGTKLTIDGKKMQQIMDEGSPVDGVSIEVVPTVAVLIPKEY